MRIWTCVIEYELAWSSKEKMSNDAEKGSILHEGSESNRKKLKAINNK